MKQPEIKHELAIAYGTDYGLEEAGAVIEVLQSLAPSCGKKVREFENAFAAYCGTRYALAVTSATTGLMLAGIAAGVGPGDEVITTPISWVATSHAFSSLGADIVFCDVDALTMNLDPDKLEERITPRTKAIIPVHLYGQCCEIDRIREIADQHGIMVITDCAHNPGGEYLGKKSGSLGHMGVFSFHQQKNMSTLGEGGMITTDDSILYERAYAYRSCCGRTYSHSTKYMSIDEEEHPMNKAYWTMLFDDVGYNFRMVDAQAAVGIEQLKKLDRHNDRRIELAGLLTEKLSGVKGLTLPYIDPKGKHVFHVYVVLVEEDFPLNKRDFMWRLYTEKGVKAWSHYMLIHLTDPYKTKGHGPGECPVAESLVDKYVSLPIHPRLTDKAVDYMADSIRVLSHS